MSVETPMRIRMLLPEDASGVAAIETELFADPWKETDIAAIPGSLCDIGYVLFLDTEMIGYCLIQKVLDEAEILRIGIKENFQHQGYANTLLTQVLELHPDAETWNLEVRDGNRPAISLYERQGFAAIGVRKNYYRNPVEDARLMQRRAKKLSDSE